MRCQRVTIAPLVLLSVVDHYKRLSTPRVIGILLGSMNNTTIEVTNSFAIPFEETDDRYFIDTSYLQHMFDLYYKVNCKERIVGWYHSGPKLHSIDVRVTKTLSKYCKMPIIAVVNVHQETSDIPCQVYRLGKDGSIMHMSIQVGADETEEVGVEHLLRDIKEGTGCSIKDKMHDIIESLRMYEACLGDILDYIKGIQEGRRPGNKRILDLFQEILHSIPRYTTGIDMSKILAAELATTIVAMNDYKRNILKNK